MQIRPHLRTLVEAEDFTDKSAQFIFENARIEELIDALKWRLARSSLGSYELPGSDVMLIKSVHMPSFKLPAITFLFKEGQDEVILIDLKCEAC